MCCGYRGPSGNESNKVQTTAPRLRDIKGAHNWRHCFSPAKGTIINYQCVVTFCCPPDCRRLREMR